MLAVAASMVAVMGPAACGGGAESSQATPGESGTAVASAPSTPTPSATPSEDTEAPDLARRARAALTGSSSVSVLHEQPSQVKNPTNRVSFDQQGSCAGEMAVEHGAILFRMIGDEAWSHPDRTWVEYDSATRSHTPPEDMDEVLALMLKWSPRAGNEAVMKDYRVRCTVKPVADLIWSDAPETKTSQVTRVGTGTVGQTPVVILRSAGRSGVAVVSVAAEGTPYPVKVELVPSNSQPGATFTLDGFGQPPGIERPRPSEIREPSTKP
ncbi:hypothetical protein GCM10018781_02630 [Kitasatospora indigofera]|uniref:Lipoprotein n=2 Tax=Kitasatospora indigofera TaxID=67307 RepID=A0A919FB30_9ACTN|nr:hypothetical protein GCM10018781_02630 [Kitasatospora indigofera]